MKNLLQQRFVFHQQFEILRRPQLPFHVAGGVESGKSIAHGLLDHVTKAIDHRPGIEAAILKMPAVGREDQRAALHLGFGVDTALLKGSIDHLHHLGTAQVETPPVVLKAGREEWDHHGKLLGTGALRKSGICGGSRPPFQGGCAYFEQYYSGEGEFQAGNAAAVRKYPGVAARATVGKASVPHSAASGSAQMPRRKQNPVRAPGPQGREPRAIFSTCERALPSRAPGHSVRANRKIMTQTQPVQRALPKHWASCFSPTARRTNSKTCPSFC